MNIGHQREVMPLLFQLRLNLLQVNGLPTPLRSDAHQFTPCLHNAQALVSRCRGVHRRSRCHRLQTQRVASPYPNFSHPHFTGTSALVVKQGSTVKRKISHFFHKATIRLEAAKLSPLNRKFITLRQNCLVYVHFRFTNQQELRSPKGPRQSVFRNPLRSNRRLSWPQRSRENNHDENPDRLPAAL